MPVAAGLKHVYWLYILINKRCPKYVYVLPKANRVLVVVAYRPNWKNILELNRCGFPFSVPLLDGRRDRHTLRDTIEVMAAILFTCFTTKISNQAESLNIFIGLYDVENKLYLFDTVLNLVLRQYKKAWRRRHPDVGI